MDHDDRPGAVVVLQVSGDGRLLRVGGRLFVVVPPQDPTAELGNTLQCHTRPWLSSGCQNGKLKPAGERQYDNHCDTCDPGYFHNTGESGAHAVIVIQPAQGPFNV